MLFPSPIKQSFKPGRLPLCSRMVIRSARTWQGWQKSVKPLMMGIEPYSAKSSTSFCAKVRIMIPSRYRESTRAVSCTGSPRPICRSRELKNSAVPPSWAMPTSKETLVRVEDFWKIIPRVMPFRCSWEIPCFCSYLSWSARFRISMISSEVRSSSFKKCFIINILLFGKRKVPRLPIKAGRLFLYDICLSFYRLERTFSSMASPLSISS